MCRNPLKAYESNPIWTSDPKHTPYRDCTKNLRPAGYAGRLGYASAGARWPIFIVSNMVAEAASGSKTPKEAAERARRKRAERLLTRSDPRGQEPTPVAHSFRSPRRPGFGRGACCNTRKPIDAGNDCRTAAMRWGAIFMLPAALLLIVFLTYPLGLGVWLGFYRREDRAPRHVHRTREL